MEIHDISGELGVVVRISRYEFATATGDSLDDNWLVIAGDVTSTDQTWSFESPCLLVDEAREIAGWFERVANQRESPIARHDDGRIGPSLTFIEPTLGFSVLGYADDTAIIRVHFSLAASPHDPREPAVDDSAAWVELRIALSDAATAAAEWHTELESLPAR